MVLKSRVAQAKSVLLGFVRCGPREVLWVPDFVNLGNLFYYWLNAHAAQSRGEQRYALETEKARAWRASFPGIFEKLEVPRSEVGFTDRRLEIHPLQHYGKDFSEAELEAFITTMLLETPNELSEEIARVSAPADLVVNIRRGDYYSVPRWRGEYSFDIVEYVRLAVAKAQAENDIQSIMVVSDDLRWCRAKLGWLETVAPVSEPPVGASVLQQLALLASSPRLILTNSTFGYWGGYIADVVRKDKNQRAVGTWVPAFHSRSPLEVMATKVSPRWNIIQDIPGGWDG